MPMGRAGAAGMLYRMQTGDMRLSGNPPQPHAAEAGARTKGNPENHSLKGKFSMSVQHKEEI